MEHKIADNAGTCGRGFPPKKTLWPMLCAIQVLDMRFIYSNLQVSVRSYWSQRLGELHRRLPRTLAPTLRLLRY